MKEIYYNPVTYPRSIIYVDKEGKAKVISKNKGSSDLLFIGDLYNVIGLYKDIIVELTSDNEAYYPELIRDDGDNSYKRIAVTGKISLNDFRDGGGYFDDPHPYPNDNRLKDGVLAWRL